MVASVRSQPWRDIYHSFLRGDGRREKREEGSPPSTALTGAVSDKGIDDAGAAHDAGALANHGESTTVQDPLGM